jgi:cell wall-associated NlpC family hydrolase
VSERGQLSVPAVGVLLLLVLAGAFLAYLVRVDEAGATAQRAADMTALAAARVLAADPTASPEAVRDAAGRAARANGGRITQFRVLRENGLPSGVEVVARVTARGSAPGTGPRKDDVPALSRAGVTYSAALDSSGFRPIDLHGARGRMAIVAAAMAQVGWPYVWGGESRAEGGFDCSGLVGFAYAAAGHPLPGRPTAATLWAMGQPVAPQALMPGDLVFRGAPSGAPYHVGVYAGQGAVIVAPRTGATVRVEPLSAGGWDGHARLAAAGPALPAAPDPVLEAARSAGAPPHVVAAELRLGLRTDARRAAAELAAALREGDDLSAALTAQLGSRSAAALVLRDASGPAIGAGFRGSVELLPRPQRDSGSGSGPAGHAGEVRVPVYGVPADGGPSRGGTAGALLQAGQNVATTLAHRGSQASVQALAGLRNGARFGLTALSLVGPPGWRDVAALGGSAWDAGFGAVEAAAAWGSAGLSLRGWALFGARLNVLAAGLSTGVFAWGAITARTRRERIGNGLLATGSAMSAAGLLTAGSGLVPLLATGAVVVPPVGLVLLSVGAVVCVGGYLVLHPEWCRSALRLGGRALDLAWRVQTAPVRLTSSAAKTGWSTAKSAAGKVADGITAVTDAIPRPWS